MLFRLSSTCFRILWDDKLRSDFQAPSFNSRQMPFEWESLALATQFLSGNVSKKKKVETWNITMKTKYVSADSSAICASGSLNKYS